MPFDLLHFHYHLGKMRRSKHGIIDDIKGVGYFFLHVRKPLNPRGRASYRIDIY